MTFEKLGIVDDEEKEKFKEKYEKIAAEDFENNYGDNLEIQEERVGKETRKKWKEAEEEVKEKLEKAKKGDVADDDSDNAFAEVNKLVKEGRSMDEAIEIVAKKLFDSHKAEDL